MNPKPENCVFVPLPVELRYHDAERAGLDLLLAASQQGGASPQGDLDRLEAALRTTLDMVDRVSAYVRSVIAGETEGNVAVGRFLMDTLAAAAPALERERTVDEALKRELTRTLLEVYMSGGCVCVLLGGAKRGGLTRRQRGDGGAHRAPAQHAGDEPRRARRTPPPSLPSR